MIDDNTEMTLSVLKTPKSNIEHKFNISVAEDVGVIAATVFYSICFWCKRNEKNGLGFSMYSTIDDFIKHRPYLSKEDMKTALSTLKEKGYLNAEVRVVIKLTPQKNFDIDDEDAQSDLDNDILIKKEKQERKEEKESFPPHPLYKEKEDKERINKKEKEKDLRRIERKDTHFVCKEKKEGTQKKDDFSLDFQQQNDPFDELMTSDIYRMAMMKNYGIDKRTLDYCINKARKEASVRIGGISRREAQSYVVTNLNSVPIVTGDYETRKTNFYNDVCSCARQLGLDDDFANYFYSYWSQISIPELEVMLFEKVQAESAWDTLRRLNTAVLSQKSKNRRYY